MKPDRTLWADLLLAAGLTKASEEQWSAAYERLLSSVKPDHAETMSGWLFQPLELSDLVTSESAAPPAWATTAQSALLAIVEIDPDRVGSALLSRFETYEASGWPRPWARELWIETWGALRRPEQFAQLAKLANLAELKRGELLALIAALGETPHPEADAELHRLQGRHATDSELLAEVELARSCRAASTRASLEESADHLPLRL